MSMVLKSFICSLHAMIFNLLTWNLCTLLFLLEFLSEVCRVLDNLKDYAVRALVNAVDHLGTVAYKLTDLLEQQTLDVSTMELKVSCLNQVIHM